MNRWRHTPLSMTVTLADGSQTTMLPMADTDIKIIVVEAGDTISGVDATISMYSAPDDPIDGILSDIEVNETNDGATMRVANLVRGNIYEISVVFAREDGTAWTRTLAIRCVA